MKRTAGSCGRAEAARSKAESACGWLPRSYWLRPSEVARFGRSRISSAGEPRRDARASAAAGTGAAPAACAAGTGRGEQQDRQCRGRRCAGSRQPRPATAHGQRQHQSERQARQPQRERELELLLAPVRVLARERLLLEALDRGRELRQAGVLRRQPEHSAAGPAGDRLQRLRVQPGHDRVAAVVALVPCDATGGVRLGDRLPGLGADSDGVNDHPCLARAAHGAVDLALEVLPVRDEHHHLVAPLHVDEGVEPLGEAHAHRGARCRHDARLDGFEEEPERVGVERQRHERVRFALECHQREAVTLEPRHQLQQRLARQEEPAGRHVRGRHGSRGVEQQHDVDSLALHLLAHDPPLRPGERDDQPRGAEQQQRHARPAPALRPLAHDARPKRERDQGAEPLAVAPRQPRVAGGHRRQQHEREQPVWRREDHRGLLTPAPRAALRPTAAPPLPTARPRPRAPAGTARGSGGRPRS